MGKPLNRYDGYLSPTARKAIKMIDNASKALTVTRIENDIVIVEMDMPGSSANVLTVDLFAELDSTFENLQSRHDLRGLILKSAKPAIFVAGADLKRIVSTLDWPDENIVKFCEDGRAVMSRLSEMPFPTIAAVHGACVGGGLELAMWCDRRIASNDRKTILGLPEVKLGLVPGWAGTVRLPRLASLETAIDLITSGRNVGAADALAAGFVNEVVDQKELLATAIQMIEAEQESKQYLRDRQELEGGVARAGDVEALQKEYGQRIIANKEIYPFACRLVMDHMLATFDKPHDEACRSESLAMAKVYGSEPSYGLLNNFFLGDHIRKKPGLVDVKLADKSISRVGIVGSGLMGSSIAEICLKRKCNVVLYDADNGVLDKALEQLSSIQSGAELIKADGYSDFSECELVIESVVEVVDVKTTVLKRIEEEVSEDAMIATNTSAIPLSKLDAVLDRPGRFCGIHFCHPQLMQLVEVIKGNQSDPATVANAAAWVKGLRKMPVVVADQAGFVVNRMLAAMLDQAFRLFSSGFAIQEIDAAMREFGFKGGPFEIVDVIGADVCMYAGREMWDAGKQCVTMAPLLPRMVKKGWLGRKTGQGFYRYESPAGERIWDPQINELLEPYVEPSASQLDIAESICSVMTLEASRLLDEKIVADPRDIDLCVIHGFSFPDHVGGVLFWADRLGVGGVNKLLDRLAQQDPKLAPIPRMREMERSGSRYY